MPGQAQGRSVHQYGGHVWCRFCTLLLGSSCFSDRARLPQYLAADTAQTWHMLVVSFFVLCSVVGVPLSWHKTSGGDTLVWVGFELLRRTRHLRLSERRAEWFTKWAREKPPERQFLGPPCRFMTIRPKKLRPQSPPVRELSGQISVRASITHEALPLRGRTSNRGHSREGGRAGQ